MRCAKRMRKRKRELLRADSLAYGYATGREGFTLALRAALTGYKRGDLLFTDLERLKQIARHAGRCSSFTAGKAHRARRRKAIIRGAFRGGAALANEVALFISKITTGAG